MADDARIEFLARGAAFEWMKPLWALDASLGWGDERGIRKQQEDNLTTIIDHALRLALMEAKKENESLDRNLTRAIRGSALFEKKCRLQEIQVAAALPPARKLRAVLAFYARRVHYSGTPRPVVVDGGAKARDALDTDHPDEILRRAEQSADLKAELAVVRREIKYLRHYGNKDCTAMADEAMETGAMES